MLDDSVTCTLINRETVECNGTVYKLPEEPLGIHDELFWIYLGVYCALVLFAGLMSGLTMGLLSLDLLSLRVLSEGGKPHERKYAKRITPIVARHHLLLVTLLLANACAVESMPIFLGHITDPIIAIAVSVTAVLIFGEVIPQAVCTRYGLAIGATLSPFVYLMLVLFFPIAWPISKVLDCVLGSESGTFFRRAELGVLVNIHQEKQEENEEPLSQDEVLIIQGALSMKSKVVQDSLMPLESVFMLDAECKMDSECMQEVLVKGPYSRLPVYQGHRGNILGILLVKTLLQVDQNTIPTALDLYKDYGRLLPLVPCDMPLYDLLNKMQEGKCHMAGVKSQKQNEESDSYEIIGIITLEDIIEELLQEEIVDETDEYVDVHRRIRVARAHLARTKSQEDSAPILTPRENRQPQSPRIPNVISPRMATKQGGTSSVVITGDDARSQPNELMSVNSTEETSDTAPLLRFE